LSGKASPHLARIASALVVAIAEGKANFDAGRLGSDAIDLLCRARELHVLLLELLLVAEPDVDERTRGRVIALGNGLDDLEAALRGDRDDVS
jgi:starvation-inducible outer membrane lipoprotein